MKRTIYFLLFLSAVAYVLPFLFIHHLWWLVFLYPIPLVYAAARANLSFKHGLFWGITTFTLHLSGVLYAIIHMARGSKLLALLPAVGIVVYLSFFVALFFACTNFVVRIASWRNNKLKKISAYSILLCFIAYWLDRACLIFLGRFEGYQLMHPLVPLAQYPPLLRLVPWLGKWGMTTLFFATTASIAAALIARARGTLIAVSVCALFWFACALVPQKIELPPAWVRNIAHLPVIFPPAEDVCHMMGALSADLAQIVADNPTVELIVMPESSFYHQALATQFQECAWLDAAHLGKKVHVIIGAFRRIDDSFFNTLFWYYNGTLQHYFDKRHTMILTESLPFFLQNSALNDLYFKQFPQRCCGQAPRQALPLFAQQSLIPYVCSELFFNESPDDAHGHEPILFIANDVWFDLPGVRYVQELMEAGARFKALQWRRPIVYVAVSRMLFVDADGWIWE